MSERVALRSSVQKGIYRRLGVQLDVEPLARTIHEATALGSSEHDLSVAG